MPVVIGAKSFHFRYVGVDQRLRGSEQRPPAQSGGRPGNDQPDARDSGSNLPAAGGLQDGSPAGIIKDREVFNKPITTLSKPIKTLLKPY